MKFKLTLFALITISIQAYSQSKNTISVQYGGNYDDVNIHGIIGDFGYQGEGGTTFSLNYERYIIHSFSLETGLMYTYDKLQMNTISAGARFYNGDIKLFTVPLIGKYTFFRYFFIDAGLLADFETNYTGPNGNVANSTAGKQSGIGYEFGFGGKYTFNHITVFINPFAQDHAVNRFSTSQSNFNLLNSGVKFGVGYSF